MGPVNADQYSRLIVINNEQLSCCLLVRRLQGLRHFDPVGDSCETGEWISSGQDILLVQLVETRTNGWYLIQIDLSEDKGFLYCGSVSRKTGQFIQIMSYC